MVVALNAAQANEARQAAGGAHPRVDAGQASGSHAPHGVTHIADALQTLLVQLHLRKAHQEKTYVDSSNYPLYVTLPAWLFR